MTTQEKKNKKFEAIISKYKHLENYCKIEVTGLNDENIYFHVTFKIADDVYITSQSDVGSNDSITMYALRVIIINDISNHSIDVSEDLLTSIVIGYHANKDVVMLALTTLSNIKHHVNQLNMYTTDYVNNILIGNSVKETTQCFINELNATNKAIEFLQKQ
jgi:hypothetical protein